MSDAFALEDLDPAFHVQFTDAVQAVTDALAASGAIRDRVRKARTWTSSATTKTSTTAA